MEASQLVRVILAVLLSATKSVRAFCKLILVLRLDVLVIAFKRAGVWSWREWEKSK